MRKDLATCGRPAIDVQRGAKSHGLYQYSVRLCGLFTDDGLRRGGSRLLGEFTSLVNTAVSGECEVQLAVVPVAGKEQECERQEGN